MEALPQVSLSLEPRLFDIVSRDDPDGAKRVLSILCGRDGEALQMTLVRRRSDRLCILRRYALDLLGALIAGTVLSFVAVQRGLRPLYGVIRKANAINAHRLTTRISMEQVPLELRELVLALNAMLDRMEQACGACRVLPPT